MIARLLLALSLFLAAPALAQDADPIATATQSLDSAAAEFQAIDGAFNGDMSPAERQGLQDRTATVKQATTASVATLTTQLGLIDARIGQLGPVTPGVVEAPDIRAQRKLLAQQRSTVDSAIKRGKLLGVEADQLAVEIGESQANAFSEKMSQRVASPLTPPFWTALLHAAPRDGRRIAAFLDAEGDAIRHGLASGGIVAALIGLGIAIGLVGPIRLALRTTGRRYVIEHVPGSRVRRSGLALWRVIVGTFIPGFATVALIEGLRSGGMLAPGWEDFAYHFQRGVFVAALVTSLAGALLQAKQGSWRLVGLSDHSARVLLPWAVAAAGTVLINVVLIAFRDAIRASDPLRAAADSAAALLYIALVLGLLLTIGRLRSRRTRTDGDEDNSQAGFAFISLAAWAIVIVAVLALAAGYVSLAYFLSRSVMWVTVVASTLYLSLLAVDDICSSLFRRDGPLADNLHHAFGLRRSLIDQFGVALSALLRLVLIAIGASLIFAPFGSNLTTLLAQGGRIAQGVTVGQITIAPGAILRAGAVLLVGLFVVRSTQHWLTNRYLPATELDAGARNSISMVARYTGLILAVLWSLASLGIGVERIALLLSALSVGIGFGLQAITQNFVSGLILLAERPVKIGDLVRIGDQEGDVKRISVRATEIQIADRSTLIVPNSELITKTIRNMTLADPIGRVQLNFSVLMGTDIGQVREMVLRMFAETPAVLDEPAPNFFVDSIADGRVNLMCFAYVRSPREVYAARSQILFELLEKLPAAGIELGTAPQRFEVVGTPPAAIAPKPEER